MRGFSIASLLLLLAVPVAAQDRGCQADQAPQAETRPPGDPGANEGAQGRVNSTADEQQKGPETRKPNLP